MSLFSTYAQTTESPTLEASFENPPNTAKPKTWMHAMSGNMSKLGLTKDLEAMAEVGIGGLLLFNVTQGIPNGPIKYNSPEHLELIKHAAAEAERLSLSFGVHNCDGWSASGGPWITPEQSMKMVVWSETIVEGGKVKTQLEQPSEREDFYRDIAVMAYPSLPSEINDIDNKPQLTSSDPNLDMELISDGKIDAESRLDAKENEQPWIQYFYETPKTLRSAKLIFNDRHATAILQISEDGENFQDVRELFKVRTGKGEWAINDHFDGITSQYFRLKFNQSVTLKETELTSTYCISNPLGRTAIARTEDHALDNIGSPEARMVIDPEQIIDLSPEMDETGMLKTKLPDGDWTILRFGYTSTGAFNNPASDEGRGLEVDKLSRPAFKVHYDAFVKKVVDQVASVAPNYAEIDSYEMGGQNWTEQLDSIFSARKGYDFLRFLPLIAGRFVESAKASETVLGDYRQVISDLMTQNYFAYFTELCHEDGIQSYIEPYGFGPLNDLDIAGVTDIPMGEFWMNRPITMTESAVSGAHIYGKPVISAESFTSNPTINWKGHPAMAKTSGDLAWTYGINEFMFHRFAHQANVHAEPGMTMNRWGFHFDRTQTWWENAGAAWFKYIARGSELLRQGVPVSDLLIYVGEGAPNSSYYRTDFKPEIPKIINFDNVNTDVLLNRIIIENNELVLPEGTSYKILVLKNVETISMPTVRRILEIAKSGVPVVGEKPKYLSGYNRSEEDVATFKKLIAELQPLIGETKDWKGVMESAKIIPDLALVNGEGIDYAHRRTTDADIYFLFNPDTIQSKWFDLNFRVENKIPELWNPMTGEIHRNAHFFPIKNGTKTTLSLNAGESVFVVFRESADDINPISFDVKDVDFSLTDADSIQATVSESGKYYVPLASRNTWSIDAEDIPEAIPVLGNWEVSFDDKGGFGKTLQFDELMDWAVHPKDSVKYHSGTASYKKSFTLPDAIVRQDLMTILDLGEVHIVADVKINGEEVGVLWMPPFEVDVTNYLKSGENVLEIAVTNQWSNRLIGDQRYPANDGGYKLGPHRATDLTMPQWYTNNEPRPEGKRTTFTTAPFYSKDDPLMPSGMLGPVQLNFSKIVTYQPKK
ncbi:MAG: glycosyl hydrolase [Pricia sp.]